MKNSILKQNVYLAELCLLSALIIIMTFVPFIGYISYGALSITLIHIPVIIGACLLGAKGGAILGGVWGVSCIIKAVFQPPTPLEGIIFRNPLIALIPRIAAGLLSALAYKALKKAFNKKAVACIAASAVACVINTVLVMGGIYLIYGNKYGSQLNISSINFGGLTNYILAAFSINSVIEIITGIIISVPVIKALQKQKKIKFL